MKKIKPETCLLITFAMIGTGFFVSLIGTSSPGLSPLMYIGLVVILAAAVFGMVFYRCPYCDGFLDRTHGEFCPHCGKRINDYFENPEVSEYFDAKKDDEEEEKPSFRAMVRAKQQLSEDECIEILKNELRGVLSVLGDNGYPYGMPINHYYCPEDGKIYFHGGKKGHKIDALRHCPKASFCVYDKGYSNFGEWALNIRSVIVFGKVEFIEDRETVYRISRELSHKFTNDEKYIEHEIEKSGPGTLMFALVPEHMTGKTVNES
jgi:nitroimidazol reductase NimA-like FMN-containing flavoprotein (pyridoxamine 5'-phosphate oxidase superfamily)